MEYLNVLKVQITAEFCKPYLIESCCVVHLYLLSECTVHLYATLNVSYYESIVCGGYVGAWCVT